VCPSSSAARVREVDAGVEGVGTGAGFARFFTKTPFNDFLTSFLCTIAAGFAGAGN
jgi:hypothetical protein